MRRTLQFCDWKVRWWRDQLSLRTPDTTDNILSEGLQAFAEQQTAQEFGIAKDWESKWRGVRARARPIIYGILHAEHGQYVGSASVEMANIYMDDDGYVRVRDDDGDDYVAEETVEIYLDDEGHGSGGEDD
jgi:hypothetical protein